MHRFTLLRRFTRRLRGIGRSRLSPRLALEHLEDRLTPSFVDLTNPIGLPADPTLVALGSAQQSIGSAAIATNEVDWYRFTSPLSGTHYFQAYREHASALQPSSAVYDAVGDRLGISGLEGGQQETSLRLPLQAGQDYYFAVTNWAGSGDYGWRIDGPDGWWEDNDTFNTAADLGTVVPTQAGFSWQHDMALLADRYDYYRFTTTVTSGPGSYVQAFSDQPGNLDLYLFDALGNMLDRSTTVPWPGTRQVEEVAFNGAAPGTYVVLVHGVDTNADYGLTVQPFSGTPAVDDAFEPNDTALAAANLGTIAAAQTFNGLVLLDHFDYYRFTTTIPGGSDSAVTLTINADPVGVDKDLYLFDAQGHLIDFATTRSDAGTEQVSLNGLPAGTYTLLVYGLSTHWGNYLNTPNPGYSLRIDPGTTAPVSDDAREPNDTLETATDLGTVSGQVSLTGLTLADSRDLYRFTTTAAGSSISSLSITFPTAQGSPWLYLLDASGRVLDSWGSNGSLSLLGRPAGTYYAMVTWLTEDTRISSYTLNVNLGLPPYADDALEDNDTPPDARALGTLTGTQTWTGLTMNDGLDYYTFTTTQTSGRSSYVEINTVQASGHLDLYLFDAAWNLLDRSTVPNQPTVGPALGFAQRLGLDGRAAGTYHLFVHGLDDNPLYTLAIDPLGSGTPLADDTLEENDLPVGAANLGTLATGQTVRSGLVMTDRYDFYQFTLAGVPLAGSVVTVQGDPTGGRLDLYLFDAGGDMLATPNPALPGSPIALAGRLAGTYVLLVHGYYLNPGYSLQFTLPPWSVRSLEMTDFGPDVVRLGFDEVTNGTVLGDTYLAQGVRFDNAVAVAGPPLGLYPVSPPNDLASTDGNPLSIRFPAGVTRVGMQIDTDGYSDSRQPQMRVYDDQGTLLGTQNFGQGPDFVGFEVAGTRIFRALLGVVPAGAPDTFVFADSFDNLSFETIAP